jgi:hypothetical protein
MSAACFIKKVSAAAKQVVAPFAQEFPAEISFGRALLVAWGFICLFGRLDNSFS